MRPARRSAHTEPAPERELGILDELRAHIRWTCRNDPWYLELDNPDDT